MGILEGSRKIMEGLCYPSTRHCALPPPSHRFKQNILTCVTGKETSAKDRQPEQRTTPRAEEEGEHLKDQGRGR